MDDFRGVVESVFRQQSGRIIASLIRISGSFDLAEEAMQDALAAALATWPTQGVPDNPAAWITTAAHRRLIDYARRARTRREKEEQVLRENERNAEADPDPCEMSFHDDRLRLIFTCCHPSLNLEAQVALTLRTLGGLKRIGSLENPALLCLADIVERTRMCLRFFLRRKSFPGLLVMIDQKHVTHY